MSYIIVQNLVSESRYSLKCPYPMVPVGICIHNTANKASARNEISYMISNDAETSFHYAVDDREVVQGLPENRNGWHASDGNGDGNRKHIAIEICYSLRDEDIEKFKEAEKNAAAFVATLLKKYNWTTANVKRHADFASKNCPHRTIALGWERFLNMIRDELNKLNASASPATNIYTVQKGDSYYAIAQKLGAVSRWQEIQALNDGRSLYPNDVIKIPGDIQVKVSTDGSVSKGSSSGTASGQKTTTVQAGEGYYQIAQRMGMTSRWQEIQSLNGNKPLYPGDTVILPG